MTVDVSTEVVIRRPREQVAAYASNPANAPVWYVNIKEIRWETPPPMSVGTRLAFVASFLGRRLSYTYEVLALDTGRLLVMSTKEGPFPMETTYTWGDTPDGFTRMRLRNRGSPSGFSSIVAPFMAASIRRANKRDLAKLKHLLEHEP